MLKLLISLFLFSTLSFSQEEHKNHYFGVIHCHSIFSTGKNNFRQLHQLATENGIQFIALTENLNLRWEYGLPFLRNLTKKEVTMPSIMMFGIKNFLDEIQRWNNRQEQVLFIPGVEVAPHYYWEEHLSDRYIKMWNYQKNILLIGPEREEIYQQIPASGNKYSDFYTNNSLLYIIPVALLFIFFLFLLKIKMVKTSIFILIISALTGYNLYPFKEMSVPIYNGDLKEKPYQNFIDYGNKKDAVTIWTSTEAKDYSEHDYKIGKVIIQTNPHPEILQATKDYTALSAIYEDNITITEPGNIWDQLLMDYLNGLRKKPIYGIGDALYHYEGQAGKYFKNVINGFWLNKLDKNSVLEAIKDGKFYGYRNNEKYRLKLTRFFATNGKEVALSGDTLSVKENPIEFKFNIEVERIPEKEISILMIRNGEIIQTLTKKIPAEFSITEKNFEPKKPSFYRFRINISNSDYILTNPIFIKP